MGSEMQGTRHNDRWPASGLLGTRDRIEVNEPDVPRPQRDAHSRSARPSLMDGLVPLRQLVQVAGPLPGIALQAGVVVLHALPEPSFLGLIQHLGERGLGGSAATAGAAPEAGDARSQAGVGQRDLAVRELVGHRVLEAERD